MKNMIDTQTGKYLTQSAYDAWLNDGRSDFADEDMWTADENEAALIHSDEMPPTDNRYKAVEAL